MTESSSDYLVEYLAQQLSRFPSEIGADYADLRSNGPLDHGTLRVLIAAAVRCIDGLSNFADAVDQDLRENARGQT